MSEKSKHSFLERAVADGHATIVGEGKPERILFEVKVERRTPDDKADLVIFSDDELKDRYFVFECKRPDISDAEFAQSIEQACGNRASLGAKFCGAISGNTRRLLRFDDPKKYPNGERNTNVIADVPVRYGKPPAWRFWKGGFRMEKGVRITMTDLPAVRRENDEQKTAEAIGRSQESGLPWKSPINVCRARPSRGKGRRPYRRR